MINIPLCRHLSQRCFFRSARKLEVRSVVNVLSMIVRLLNPEMKARSMEAKLLTKFNEVFYTKRRRKKEQH